MTLSPTAPFRDMMWRVVPDHATAWRAWDGEMVVYDDISGDTLKLDVIMAASFQRLLRGPATTSELVEGLAELLEMDEDPRLRRLVEIALERFVLCDLAVAEPLSAPDPEAPSPEAPEPDSAPRQA